MNRQRKDAGGYYAQKFGIGFSSAYVTQKKTRSDLPELNNRARNLTASLLKNLPTDRWTNDPGFVQDVLANSLQVLMSIPEEPNIQLMLALLYVAKVKHSSFKLPTLHKTLLEILCSGSTYKANNQLPVLAANLLYRAYMNDAEWPLDLLTAYLEDAVTVRCWVDDEQARLFVINVTSGFVPRSQAACSTNRYASPLQQQQLRQVVTERVVRAMHDPTPSQEQLRVLVLIACDTVAFPEIRTAASAHLSAWVQHPSTGRHAREYLNELVRVCRSDTEADQQTVRNIVQLQPLKLKVQQRKLFLEQITTLVRNNPLYPSIALKHFVQVQLNPASQPSGATTAAAAAATSSSSGAAVDQAHLQLLGIIYAAIPPEADPPLQLARIFQEIATSSEHRETMPRLLDALLRTLSGRLDVPTFCRALMLDRDEMLARPTALRHLWLFNLLDVLCLTMLLSAPPAASHANSTSAAASGAALSPEAAQQLAVYRQQVCTVQNEAVAWLHGTVPRYLPGAALEHAAYAYMLRKVLFLEPLASYLPAGHRNISAARQQVFRLLSGPCSITEDTLTRVVIMNLQGLPLHSSSALDVLERSLRRAAALSLASVENPAAPSAVLRVANPQLADAILKISLYKAPEAEALDTPVAVSAWFWQACIVVALLACFNPDTIGQYAWRHVPTMRALLTVLLTRQFAHPPLAHTSFFARERELLHADAALVAQLRRLRSSTLRSAPDQKSEQPHEIPSLLAYQPQEVARLLPAFLCERLHQLDRELHLGRRLCNSREPDFLRDTMRNDPMAMHRWLGALITAEPGMLAVLPPASLVELLYEAQRQTGAQLADDPNLPEIVFRLLSLLRAEPTGPAEPLSSALSVLRFLLDRLAAPDPQQRALAHRSLALLVQCQRAAADLWSSPVLVRRLMPQLLKSLVDEAADDLSTTTTTTTTSHTGDAATTAGSSTSRSSSSPSSSADWLPGLLGSADAQQPSVFVAARAPTFRQNAFACLRRAVRVETDPDALEAYLRVLVEPPSGVHSPLVQHHCVARVCSLLLSTRPLVARDLYASEQLYCETVDKFVAYLQLCPTMPGSNSREASSAPPPTPDRLPNGEQPIWMILHRATAHGSTEEILIDDAVVRGALELLAQQHCSPSQAAQAAADRMARLLFPGATQPSTSRTQHTLTTLRPLHAQTSTARPLLTGSLATRLAHAASPVLFGEALPALGSLQLCELCISLALSTERRLCALRYLLESRAEQCRQDLTGSPPAALQQLSSRIAWHRSVATPHSELSAALDQLGAQLSPASTVSTVSAQRRPQQALLASLFAPARGDSMQIDDETASESKHKPSTESLFELSTVQLDSLFAGLRFSQPVTVKQELDRVVSSPSCSQPTPTTTAAPTGSTTTTTTTTTVDERRAALSQVVGSVESARGFVPPHVQVASLLGVLVSKPDTPSSSTHFSSSSSSLSSSALSSVSSSASSSSASSSSAFSSFGATSSWPTPDEQASLLSTLWHRGAPCSWVVADWLRVRPQLLLRPSLQQVAFTTDQSLETSFLLSTMLTGISHDVLIPVARRLLINSMNVHPTSVLDFTEALLWDPCFVRTDATHISTPGAMIEVCFSSTEFEGLVQCALRELAIGLQSQSPIHHDDCDPGTLHSLQCSSRAPLLLGVALLSRRSAQLLRLLLADDGSLRSSSASSLGTPAQRLLSDLYVLQPTLVAAESEALRRLDTAELALSTLHCGPHGQSSVMLYGVIRLLTNYEASALGYRLLRQLAVSHGALLLEHLSALAAVVQGHVMLTEELDRQQRQHEFQLYVRVLELVHLLTPALFAQTTQCESLLELYCHLLLVKKPHGSQIEDLFSQLLLEYTQYSSAGFAFAESLLPSLRALSVSYVETVEFADLVRLLSESAGFQGSSQQRIEKRKQIDMNARLIMSILQHPTYLDPDRDLTRLHDALLWLDRESVHSPSSLAVAIVPLTRLLSHPAETMCSRAYKLLLRLLHASPSLAREVFPEYMACFSHENGSVRAAAIYHATNMFHYAETQRNVLLQTLFSLGPHASSSLHTLLCECMHLPA